MNNTILTSLQNAHHLLGKFLAAEENINAIKRIATQMAEVYERKGKLIIFGNGGSMCDAMHFAEELTGRYHHDRAALPAIAISDPSHLSCVANDYGYDMVFARAVEAYAQPGDMVIGISTSGNSANVIKALETAAKRDCFTCVLLGKDGGLLNNMADYQIIIPSEDTARIQEVHGIIIHILIETVEKLLFTRDDAYLKDDPKLC